MIRKIRPLLLLSLLISTISFSQFKPSNIKPYPKEEVTIKKQWYQFSPGVIIMKFNQNTVGVIDAISTIKEILKSNNLDFDSPTTDKSFIASYITGGITDYENINLSCYVGGSVIIKGWTKKVGTQNWTFGLNFTEKMYMVMVVQR